MPSYTASASNIAAVISALVGLPGQMSIAGISPVPLPDDAFKTVAGPWVTVQEISTKELQTQSGGSGVGPSIIQVNVWNAQYEYADAARKRIYNILSNLSGSISVSGSVGGGSVSGAVVCQGSNFMGNHELYDPIRELHQLVSRFQMWFEI